MWWGVPWEHFRNPPQLAGSGWRLPSVEQSTGPPLLVPLVVVIEAAVAVVECVVVIVVVDAVVLDCGSSIAFDGKFPKSY